jgi:hypothetical protein
LQRFELPLDIMRLLRHILLTLAVQSLFRRVI